VGCFAHKTPHGTPAAVFPKEPRILIQITNSILRPPIIFLKNQLGIRLSHKRLANSDYLRSLVLQFNFNMVICQCKEDKKAPHFKIVNMLSNVTKLLQARFIV